jgi:hypothetical protein
MISEIQALDNDLKPLQVGDEVRFAMPGFFQTRTQEFQGRILDIDAWGGISIQVDGSYRHCTSTGAIAAIAENIYFIHHIYDSAKKARIYKSPNDPEQAFISKLSA